MHFCFLNENHGGLGKESIYDIIDAVVGQLVDLGHTCSWANGGTLRPDVINVIIEGFSQNVVEQMRGMKTDKGIPLVIITTERPGRPGFNNDRRPEMIERQRVFPRAAAEAAAVWCLVPGVARWARQWCPRTIDLELGWSAAREKHLRGGFGADERAVFDFAFYGSLTPRRKNIIAEIERRGYLVMTAERNVLSTKNQMGFLSLEERNGLVGSAKVVLGIHQFPGWSLVSNSRFATALSLGRALLNEPHRGVETPWHGAGVFSRTIGSFVDEAIAILPHWQEVRDQQIARFRELFSPARCVGEALRLTLPGLEAVAA
jgi:hypothetical protein